MHHVRCWVSINLYRWKWFSVIRSWMFINRDCFQQCKIVSGTISRIESDKNERSLVENHLTSISRCFWYTSEKMVLRWLAFSPCFQIGGAHLQVTTKNNFSLIHLKIWMVAVSHRNCSRFWEGRPGSCNEEHDTSMHQVIKDDLDWCQAFIGIALRKFKPK